MCRRYTGTHTQRQTRKGRDWREERCAREFMNLMARSRRSRERRRRRTGGEGRRRQNKRAKRVASADQDSERLVAEAVVAEDRANRRKDVDRVSMSDGLIGQTSSLEPGFAREEEGAKCLRLKMTRDADGTSFTNMVMVRLSPEGAANVSGFSPTTMLRSIASTSSIVKSIICPT